MGSISSPISSFAKSGMWDFKTSIGSAAVGIPLAIEGACLLKNMWQKPGYLKEKLLETQQTVLESFTPKTGEETREAVLRIAKNTFIVLACLAFMGAAAYLSIQFLPASMAISTAISAIILIGKLFLNAKAYKQQIIEAFTAKPEEDPLAAKSRIHTNILKTVALVCCVAGAILIGAYVLIPLLQKFSWSVSLPFQTKLVVFFEYAALGILHAGIALSKYLKGDKAGALFHLTAAVAAIAFPVFYWNHEMRLHHSFYGLAMMALPSRTAKILGSAITFDASLYMLEPLRGGYVAPGDFVRYDFINIIVDRFPLFFKGYTAASIAENVNDNWSESTEVSKAAS